ncbi:MAG: hypothetical protein ISN29_06530 [Gammaproteobacteria bacterium AqS3]|nr:hypothetical protein [Gammaproteobacteria bacterium AqS3]
MIPDNPILTKDKDLLRRYPLASGVAGEIKRYQGDESLVIGIEGEWGSGKTSFINLVLEGLREADDVLIIEFNPWNFSNQDEIVKDLFNSLIDALKQTGRKKWKKHIKKIINYSLKLLKHSDITISFFGFLKWKLGGFHDLGGDDPLEMQKQEVNSLLKKIGKQIVIVVDDIDRLDSQETKLIFKLVKMTANFANTIFLLAYDRGKVGKRMNEKGIKGEEYMKKIIQVSFTLPKPESQDLFEILFDGINATFLGLDKKTWDDVRRGNLFHSGFKKLFPTIRDIRRYINSLQLDLKIIGKEEVNPIDFLGVEAIRVFAPEVYLAMTGEKEVFTAVDNRYVTDDNRELDARRQIHEQIIKKSPEGLADAIGGIIQQLFPQVKVLDSDVHYSSDQQQEWRRQLRVCSEDIFDKYFALSVPSTVLSEKRFNDVLNATDSVSVLAKILEKLQKEDKLRLALWRLPDYLDNLNDQQRENLFLSVFDIAEDVKDYKHGAFDLQDIGTQAWGLGYQILKRVKKEKRMNFLTQIFHSSQSVSLLVLLVLALIQDMRKHEWGPLEPEEEPLFAKDKIDELNKLCVRKIKHAAENGSLAGKQNFLFLLDQWKKWVSEEAVKNYVDELIKTDKGLLDFLRCFVSETTVHDMDDYSSKNILKINKESIKPFGDIDELNRRVSQIDESGLDQDEAEIINLYKNRQRFD